MVLNEEHGEADVDMLNWKRNTCIKCVLESDPNKQTRCWTKASWPPSQYYAHLHTVTYSG